MSITNNNNNNNNNNNASNNNNNKDNNNNDDYKNQSLKLEIVDKFTFFISTFFIPHY